MDEFSGVYVRDCNRMFKPRESASVGRRAVVHVLRSGVSRLLLERTPTKTTKEESGRKGGGGKGDEKRRRWRRRVYRRERGRESVERSFVSSSSFVISDDAANALENSSCFRNQMRPLDGTNFKVLCRKKERKRFLSFILLSLSLSIVYVYI